MCDTGQSCAAGVTAYYWKEVAYSAAGKAWASNESVSKCKADEQDANDTSQLIVPYQCGLHARV